MLQFTRKTGRTNKMLLKSILTFLEGNDVIVVAHSTSYAYDLKDKCMSVLNALAIPFVSRSNLLEFNNKRIIFVSSYDKNISIGFTGKVFYNHWVY